MSFRKEPCVTMRLTLSVVNYVKVGAQTETELKEKKLRVEDALNATKVNFCHWTKDSIILTYRNI